MEINKCSQNYNCVFLANIHSPKLRFKQDDFLFVLKDTVEIKIGQKSQRQRQTML